MVTTEESEKDNLGLKHLVLYNRFNRSFEKMFRGDKDKVALLKCLISLSLGDDKQFNKLVPFVNQCNISYNKYKPFLKGYDNHWHDKIQFKKLIGADFREEKVAQLINILEMMRGDISAIKNIFEINEPFYDLN